MLHGVHGGNKQNINRTDARRVVIGTAGQKGERRSARFAAHADWVGSVISSEPGLHINIFYCPPASSLSDNNKQVHFACATLSEQDGPVLHRKPA